MKVTSDDPNPGFLAEKLDSSIFTVQPNYIVTIKDGGINGSMIADGSITSADIADRSITSEKIALNAVTSEHIADGSIGTAELADGSVTSSKLAPNSVTGSHVADGSLTGADIADNSITGADIADSSITGSDIADKSITSADIAEVAWSIVDKTGSSLSDLERKSFLDLDDTPSTYAGAGGYYLRVKATEDGIEFTPTAPTGPSSMVRAYLRTSYAVPADQWTTVTYDGETVDLNDEYDNGVFIPKESGWYIVYAQATFDYNDQGFRTIAIFKNGVPVSWGTQLTAIAASGRTRVSIYDLVWLNAGDRLEIKVWRAQVSCPLLGTDNIERGTYLVIYKLK